MKPQQRTLELLAPARNADIACQALIHGADAVYIGSEGYGARASAANSVDDIARVVDMAHTFGARVYVTVNTIVYEHELPSVQQLVRRLYRAGVDALIVQDLSLLRLDLPPIELHASTQCDIRTPDKARFLESLGFSQLVLPREFSLNQIREVATAVNVPLEAFVHGALCVSYSGDCQASYMACGRSANRGECAQICRQAFDLYAAGHRVMEQKHLLSLRDLNRSGSLEAMADAGISSFKIEGRLKDAAYVKNVVAYYRQRLDAIIAAHPDRYRRASHGDVRFNFTPDLSRSFNRGFTGYFVGTMPNDNSNLASIDTPKSIGQRVGTVARLSADRRHIEAHLDVELANGDGLGYFDRDNRFVGFRVNKVEGKTIISAKPVNPPRGAELWRNSDKAFDDLMGTSTATRTISVDMTLRSASGAVALDITDSRGLSATATLWPDTPFQQAHTAQVEQHSRLLARLGDTPLCARDIDDRCTDLFIPASQLTDLRRRAVNNYLRVVWLAHIRPLRRPEEHTSTWHGTTSVDRHANVANSLARQVYTDHSIAVESTAVETGATPEDNPVVMSSRYCLRRQLGACMREGGASRLPEPLTLVTGQLSLRAEFDCRNCLMRLRKQ